MSRIITDLNKKINELWQSQKKEFGGNEFLWLALFLTFMGVFAIIQNIIFDSLTSKIINLYFVVILFYLMIVLIATYLYTHNKLEVSDWVKKWIIFFYKLLLIISFVLLSPFLFFWKLICVVINYRAKKIDNLLNWMIILSIDLFVIIMLTNFNFFVIEVLSKIVQNFFDTYYKIKIDEYPSMLVILFMLYKVEMDITNMFILKIMRCHIISRIEYGNKENSYEKDVVEYGQKEINKIKEKQFNDLKYDLEYLKKTIWKFQLICLIFLFIVATFAPNYLFENQSDAVNVITLFTLFMLYVDKRKEWK